MTRNYYIAIIRKRILITFLSFVLFNGAEAQDYTSVQYVVGIPMNDLRNFISDASYHGFSFEYYAKFTSRSSVGASIGLNSFYERKIFSIQTEGETISEIQLRNSSAVPVHVGGMHVFRNNAGITLFVAMGIGTTYTLRQTETGHFRQEEEMWSFSLKPEAGFMYTFENALGLKFGLRYNEVFKTNKLKDQSFLAVAVGLVFVD